MFIALLTTASASTLLNDQFATNGPINAATTQNLPTSAAWYTGGATVDANVVSNQLVFSNILTTNTRGGVAYFTTSGSPFTLVSTGDSIQLAFQYSYGANDISSNAFRVGLYNSNGTRLTADNSGFNIAAVNGWTGYDTVYTFGTIAATRFITYERAAGANNLTSNNTQVGAAGTTVTAGGTANTTYDATMTLTKTASGVSITTVFDGQSLTREDTTSAYTSFDTIGLLTSAPSVGSLKIDNVVVTAVPEPATWLLLGIGLTTMVVFRRRTA